MLFARGCEPPVRSHVMWDVHVLRVFTREDVGGNHLGVVTDVDDLTAERMQAIATQLGYSETVFIDVPARSIRIFTPADELPFAGHPLVGAAAFLAEEHGVSEDTLSTGVGPIRYQAAGWRADVECRIPVTPVDPDDVAEVSLAAGMPMPITTACLGLPKEYLIAEYADAMTVGALVPDMEALTGRFGFLAYARAGDEVKARFFAPGTAVPEDPATGSAAVALAHALRLRGEARGHLTISQGDEIGHPSTIHLEWDGPRTTIGGSVRSDGTRRIG